MNATEIQSGHYGLMCRKTWIEQRRTLLMAVVVFMAFCAVPGLWAGYYGIKTEVGGFVPYIFFTGIGCAYAASRAFGELTSKAGRISLLMTPSTTAEKFWPRVVVATIGVALLVAVGWVVVGLTNNLMICMKYGFRMQGIFNPFENCDKDTLMITAMMLSCYLANQSLFIFGSVAWPKRSFLKSFAIFVLAMVAWVLLMTGLSRLLNDLHVEPTHANRMILYWSILAFLLAVAAGLLTGAYYKLKHKQVA